jgi:DNA-3-methyladenine glycosylase
LTIPDPLVDTTANQDKAGRLPDLIARKLPPAFYEQPTLELARQLLGKTLVCLPLEEGEAGATAGIIVEVEGYVGAEDPACHAFNGRTRRNETMWGPSGRAYVYFTYGNHWMLNVVTEDDGYPAAALIRAVQPTLGRKVMHERRGLHLLKTKAEDRHLTNGPGKLCQAMAITGKLNGQSLQGPHLFLAETPPDLALPPFELVETTRIGISRGQELPWRYYVKDNRFVSRLARL